MSSTKVLKSPQMAFPQAKKPQMLQMPHGTPGDIPKPRLKLFLEEVVWENGESSVAMDQGQAMSNASFIPSLSVMSPGSVVASERFVDASSPFGSLIGFSGLSQCKDPGGAVLPLGR
mmetsp:Transcript_44328/g.72860  ORF Transcript_44328/g.72860 Transcript_44328/m.72860 type:complete len:117 (+) Transcript_44328:27-377(+)